MNTIKVMELHNIVSDMASRKEISNTELWETLKAEYGSDWSIKRDDPQWDEQDVNAVAASRYFHRVGIKLLAVLLGVFALLMVISTFTSIKQIVTLPIVGVAALVVLYLYTTQLSRAKKEMRESVFGKK